MKLLGWIPVLLIVVWWLGTAPPASSAPSAVNLSLTFGGRTVANLVCGLESAAEGWEVERGGEEGATRETARSPKGLVWERTLKSLDGNVFELGSEVRNEGEQAVKIEHAVITLEGDRQQFTGFSALRNYFWHGLVERFDYQLTPYYGVFFLHGRDFVIGLSLRENAQLPGTFTIFGEENLFDLKLAFNAMYTRPADTSHPYAWGPWVLLPRALEPGEKISWHLRAVVWPRDESQYHPDVPPVAGKGTTFIPTQEQMATLGWTWQPPDTRVRGHIMHASEGVQTHDSRWRDLPEYAARAGVEYLVVLGELGDISHGLSGDRDYARVQGHLPELIDRCHRYGVKVVPWYSPSGAYIGKPPRPVEKRDPMVQQHLKDWFLEGSIYWHDMYVTSNPFSGWYDWFLAKVDHDLTVLPTLDGIAVDEPFACLAMWDEETNKSGFTRQVEFMRDVRAIIKRHGREKVFIANEGITPPQANDIFDAQTLEAWMAGWMRELMSGRLAARPGGKYYEWDYLYNYYRDMLFRWDAAIGWAHLAWFVACKPREQWRETADLLRPGVMGGDVTRSQPAPDLYQMEIHGDDGTWWVLLNDGPARELSISPQRALPAGEYRRFVWVDGPTGPRRIVEEPHEVTLADNVTIALGEVPEKGIVTVASIPLSEWQRTQQSLADAARAVQDSPGSNDMLRSRVEGARFVADLGFLRRARKLAAELVEQVGH